MQTGEEHYIRWEPLPCLPECPLSDVAVTFDDGLKAVAAYSHRSQGETLHIDFGHVEAFKVYEEFSSPLLNSNVERPLVKSADRFKWVWPLLEVKNSEWVERVVARNGAITAHAWRHFEIVTRSVCLHVMTEHEPRNVRLTDS